jgi:hypothetical protein
MKKFYFLPVIIFISLDLSAQQVQPSPPDWIRINAGDSFAIRTTVTHIGQKRTLVGTLLRIVGAGAAAYESGKFVETNLKKGKTGSMQNTWIPPAGVGLILFGDDIAGIKKPHTGFVGYTLFSNDKVALERNTVRLDNKAIRKNGGILLSGRAQQDGFLRIEGTQGEGKNVDILLDWMPGKTLPGDKAADLPLSPIAELPVSVKASVPAITPDIPLVPAASSVALSRSGIVHPRVAPVTAGIKAAIPRTGSPAGLTPTVIRPAKSLPGKPVTQTKPSENNKKPAAPFLTTVDWIDERTEEGERNEEDEEFPGRFPIDFLKRLLTAKRMIEVDGYDGDEGGYGEDGNLGNDESGYDDSSDSDDMADGGGAGDDTDDSGITDDSGDTDDSGYDDDDSDADDDNGLDDDDLVDDTTSNPCNPTGVTADNLCDAFYGTFNPASLGITSTIEYSTSAPPGWTVVNGNFVSPSGAVALAYTPNPPVTFNTATGTYSVSGPITTYVSPNAIAAGANVLQSVLGHEAIHAANLDNYTTMAVEDPAQFTANTEYAAYTYQAAVACANYSSESSQEFALSSYTNDANTLAPGGAAANWSAGLPVPSPMGVTCV